MSWFIDRYDGCGATKDSIPHPVHLYPTVNGEDPMPSVHHCTSGHGILRGGPNEASCEVQLPVVVLTMVISRDCYDSRSSTGHSYSHSVTIATRHCSRFRYKAGARRERWLTWRSDDVKVERYVTFGRDLVSHLTVYIYAPSLPLYARELLYIGVTSSISEMTGTEV